MKILFRDKYYIRVIVKVEEEFKELKKKLVKLNEIFRCNFRDIVKKGCENNLNILIKLINYRALIKFDMNIILFIKIEYRILYS